MVQEWWATGGGESEDGRVGAEMVGGPVIGQIQGLEARVEPV